MKKVLAALMAVIAICSVSRADQIIIYRGIQSDRQNDAPVKHYGYYYIFDLSTAQFEDIQFGPVGGGATKTSKYFSTGTNTAFIDAPATEKAARTQTDFLYTSSTSGTPFAVSFGDFKGVNIAHDNLGGSFSGQFPETLSLVARIAAGDGTVPGDHVQIVTGAFHIALNVTRTSNASDDDITGAISVVTDALQKEGYAPEP